jgi:hypothetical protein
MSRFLRAGAIAGATGGLVMAIVLRLLGEGPIGDAVAIESRNHPGEAEMFTRSTQHLGGIIGILLYGVFVGIILAVVLAAVRHRLPLRDDWWRSVTLAAIGFGTIVLVPFLKYPANPPTVGDPSTITRRTVLYLAMLAFSIGATVLTWRFASYASSRWSRQVAVPVTIALYLAVVSIAFAAFPPFTDKIGLSATLMWHFRLDSLAGNAALWSVLGLTLGGLVIPRPERTKAAELVGSRG